MDRFFGNPFPDFRPHDPPLIQDSCFQSRDIETAAAELLQLLESKLDGREEVDWSDVSVYTGTSGYSLLYYFLFKRTGRQQYLQKCHKYAALSIKKRASGRVTFLCGDAGPLVVSALAHCAADDMTSAMACINRLLSLLPLVIDHNSRMADELLYGRTGFLFALNLLRQEIPAASESITDDVIRQVLTAIIDSGQRTASQCGTTEAPLFFYWHDSAYVGAAHGFCGIIYHLLLNDRLLRKQELETLIKPTLDFLLSLRFPSGNIRSSCGKDADRLVHWCHGAPGFVYTLVQGYRVFGDQKYLDAALLSGDVIWNRGLLKKGYGLCHGVAGNAYAFLSLFSVLHQISNTCTERSSSPNSALSTVRMVAELQTHPGLYLRVWLEQFISCLTSKNLQNHVSQLMS